METSCYPRPWHALVGWRRGGPEATPNRPPTPMAGTFRLSTIAAMAALVFTGCTCETSETQSCCLVRIEAGAPDAPVALYLSGNVEALGSWRPDIFEMADEAGLRVAELMLPPGTELEYKFTLGSWDREALGPSGTVMPNFRLTVDGPETVRHKLDRFMADPGRAYG